MKEIELINLRKKREKHFLQENGNIIAKMYQEDIHFQKDNHYEEIDNTLMEEEDYYYNKNNSYQVSFKKQCNDYFFKTVKENYYINMKLNDSNSSQIELEDNHSKLYQDIKYKNVLKGIDLEYHITPNGVKEDIIISKPSDLIEEIIFDIDTNLELELQNNRIIAFSNNNTVFKMEEPYIIDFNGKKVHHVTYSFYKMNNIYKLTLMIDKKSLEKEEITYPIVIDPSIVVDEKNNVYDTYIYSGDTNVNRNSQDILKAGVEKVNGKEVINRTLLKFDLPTIGTGSQVVGAELRLIGYPVLNGSYESDIVAIHRVTSSWSETSANWSNMSNKYDSKMESAFFSNRSSKDALGNIEVRMNWADVTNLVKKWYSSVPNYGIMLKMNTEKYRNSIIPAFFSKDNKVTGSNPKPVLVVTYRNQNGLEDYMDYKGQTFAIGNTYVNSYNGNLTGVFSVGSTKGAKLPANLNLVYNTNDVILNRNLGYGKGFQFNFNQTIKEVTIDQVKYLEYVDEDGTIHYFREVDGVMRDEDGLDMTIETTQTEYILKDKNDNQMKFLISNKVGYLTQIIDVSENKIMIEYNSNHTISKVIDSSNTEINITYLENQILIASPDENVYLNYTNNQLVNITTKTGTTIFEYNTNSIITKITDENGLKTAYEYYSQLPYRVKKVIEYSVDNELGNSLTFTYHFNSTTIVDHKDRSTTMTFNNFGNIQSITNLKSRENINEAYGSYQKYGDYDYDDGTTRKSNKNKLLQKDIPYKYVNNLLTNTSFENEIESYFEDTGIKAFTTNETAHHGFQSYKIVSTANNKEYVLIDYFPSEKNKCYTFSAYLKNDKPIRMSFSYLDFNDIVQEVVEDIPINEEFERYDITIYYNSLERQTLKVKLYLDEPCTVYVDDVQLELGKVMNNYNLLENSDFSDSIETWNLSARTIEGGNDVNTDQIFEVVDLEEGISALKIKMNPAISTSFDKSFKVQGKAGDRYQISFWYKHEGFLGSPTIGDLIYNNVIIRYHYLDEEGGCVLPSQPFNPNDTEWQYFSTTFEAEKDFKQLDLDFFQQFNANNFYITNICLFQDIRSVEYEYDERGNLKKVDDLNNQNTDFKYDKNNQLIQMTDPKGKKLKYEYDNIKTDQVLNGISETGISNKIKYDNFGNPIQTRIMKNIKKNIETGKYKIRGKGTNTYIKSNQHHIVLTNHNCNHTNWNIIKEGEYFKIKHLILDKYIAFINNQLYLTTNQGDKSLFTLKQNTNGSYLIKPKSSNNYLKLEESLTFSKLIEDDYHFEFYLECSEYREFLQNDAEYTEDGKFIKSTTDTNFNKVLYDIDPLTGLTKSLTNAKGLKTEYTYNEKQQPILIQSKDHSVSYEYNDNNSLNKIIHGNKEYQFVYDGFLNTKQIKIGDNITLVTNEFEENNGNLISSTYGNNHKIEYVYDEFDRVIKIIKMNEEYEYSYNNNGDLVKVISENDNEKFTYDMAKRLSEYRMNDFKVHYKYDSNENIIEQYHQLGNIKHTITNTYNEDEIVTKVKIDDIEENYIYDHLDRVISTNINNQLNTNYQYMRNGNRASLLVKGIQNILGNYSYRYDKLNNITRVYKDNQLENRYYYDEYNQLIKEDNYKTNETIIYEYDNVGNIQNKKVYELNTDNLLSQNTYQYENANWEDQLTKFNNEIITYDGIGNPLSIGNNIILNWINGRQLSSYVDLNNNINYLYNKDGIRISKKINNIETKYYLEGDTIIFEQTEDNMIYYIYNIEDELIGFKYNNEVYYYIKNHLNDIVAITDSNYNIIVTYEYDSWGNILSIKDENNQDISNNNTHIGNINPYRYRSYYYDKETNLYYLNSRYYNPVWGRFINADGIINSNQDYLSHNLYIYGNNNPVMNVDPSGRGFFSAIGNWVKKKASQVVKAVQGYSKYKAGKALKKISNVTLAFWPDATKMFQNSLKKSPPALTYGKNSALAQKIKNSPTFKSTMDTFAKNNSNGKFDKKKQKIIFPIKKESNLGLGIHKGNLYITGTLENGCGTLHIRLEDNYDFKHEEYSKDIAGSFVTAINNVANVFEEQGVIKNYPITVEFDYTIACK